MKVVTTDEMRRIEKQADASGHTYADMMERAGQAVALAVSDCLGGMPAQVLVLAGPGSNGGDGLVAARHLHEWGHECTVYVWNRTAADDPNMTKLQELDVPVVQAKDDEGYRRLTELAQEADVIIDALLGTGARGPLRDGLAELIDQVRRAVSQDAQASLIPLTGLYDGADGDLGRGTLIVAVDGPSGLDFDTGEIDPRALKADVSVTFAFPKPGQFVGDSAEYVGDLVVADIGIDPALAPEVSLEVATPQQVASMLPPRPSAGHKGSFGKAMIVAGSSNYVGAPALAAEACYRVGAGLVTVGIPASIQPMVACRISEATYLMLPHDMGAITERAVKVVVDNLDGYDALLVGPGLGREAATGDFVAQLIGGGLPSTHRPVGFRAHSEPADTKEQVNLPPLVIDADALNLLADRGAWWEQLRAPAVLTPHPGEMARLIGGHVEDVQRDRLGTALRYAAKWGVTVVLKGAFTMVAAADGRSLLMPFANPAMGTAGTGDVLAGAIVGLLAQGLAPYEAAVCGAYVHGMAGELRRREIGGAGMLAGDLQPLLPAAMRILRGG